MAWELAAAAHPHLSRVDADRIYIAIGVGDTFEAIDALLTAIARDGIPGTHPTVVHFPLRRSARPLGVTSAMIS